MKTRESKMDDGRRQSRSVLECGGPSPLSARQSVVRGPWSVVLLMGVCFLLSVFCFCAQAQLAINWHTIDGGGGTSTNGQYSLSGTIGQPDAGGPMTNGQYAVTGGFWALPTAIQTEGAPTLTISKGAPGLAVISWTPSTGTNWILQERIDLIDPHPTNVWIGVAGGTNNPVSVPITTPRKFYRLFKP